MASKERIVKLIDSLNQIEKLFHTNDGFLYSIHDVPEFQDWLQETSFELIEIHNRTHDRFVKETINCTKQKMNGYNDRSIFNEIRSRLQAIRKNIDQFYPCNYSGYSDGGINTMTEKQPKLFISHSSKDESYVNHIVNLIDGMGLNDSQILCSSLPGYGVPIDTDFYEYLRNQFLQYRLHVIFVHSANYYSSPISLNEMGAAWVLKTAATSILLPGFRFDQMTGVVNSRSISIKLDAPEMEVKDKLNQLYDQISIEFRLQKKSAIIWEKRRDSFIADIQHTAPRSSGLVLPSI